MVSVIRERIAVVGGGIAGVEAAITLARTVPRAHVVLVSRWRSLRMLPNLVYVPFGGSDVGVDVQLRRVLAADGVELRTATCDSVDLDTRTLHLSDGDLRYDAVVFALGTVADRSPGAYNLRGLTDATDLRAALERIAARNSPEDRILLRVPSSCSWTPPAFELAMLLGQWRADRHLDVQVTLAIEELEPLDVFEFDASQAVRDRLEQLGVELLGHVPGHRLDQIPATICIDFGSLEAQRIPGLPPAGADGFYAADESGSVAPNAYMVGDAVDTPYKAGFATGLQARRIARALGGDLRLLGTEVDGIPIDQCEYQMDIGGQTLHVRLKPQPADRLFFPLREVSVTTTPGRPDKLAGLLVHDAIAARRPSIAEHIARRTRSLGGGASAAAAAAIAQG